MNYLFYGIESFLIKQEVKKVLEKYQIDPISVSEYNLEETPIQQIIDDAETVSLFSSQKAIIVNHSFVFTAGSKKGIEQDTDALLSYLEHSNPDTILLFLVEQEKIDERKKISKAIKNTGTIKSFTVGEHVNSTVKQMFGDYQIDFQTVDLLIHRVGKDLNQLDQEVQKLKTCQFDEKKITGQDVIELTATKESIDIFEFIEAIVSKNKEKAIAIYKEMLKMNEEPIKIIVLIANQFRLIYQVKELFKRGHTEKDIADMLNIHPYRIKLALQKGRNYQSELILSYLQQLADLDIGIKTGKVEKELGLELFILGVS